MSKVFRNTIAEDDNYDVDIVNCCATLLYNEMESKTGIDKPTYPKLTFYVTKRDELVLPAICNVLGIKREEAKNICIQLMNGKKISDETKSKLPFLENFEIEMKKKS